ncbi:MAG: hypothetical protein ACR2JB_15935 [Bryobacteraceae bacterium]
MSQIALTSSERLAALQRFGYTKREAAFLCLAALHGGYFLRRQYGQCIGRQDGGSANQLVEKTLALGHAQVSTFKANTHIYHLAARPFYAALGQEDNRNRRLRQAQTIKAKLMALDFVLAHPAAQYLATEQEKLQYFENTLGIPPEALPTKKYTSRGLVTERYFVEKYPIFVSPSPEPAVSPVVSFCFVDPGLASVSAFETFLADYDPLFSALRSVEVVYLATNEILTAQAAMIFARMSGGPAGPILGLTKERMLAYFEARLLYENRQWASFDRSKLIILRDGRDEFSGSQIESLYALWRSGGDAALVQNGVVEERVGATNRRRLSTFILPHRYDFFGNLARF